MDQTQDQLDPEVAQEVITLLNKKITNLRAENAQLQVGPGRMPRDRPYETRSDLNAIESTQQSLCKDGRWNP